MEAAIPLFALGSLYFVNKQNKNKEKKEGFYSSKLPNTNLRNQNYPSEGLALDQELQQTEHLSRVNKYDNSQGSYTDKYFAQSMKTGNIQEDINRPKNVSKISEVSGEQFKSLTGDTVSSNYFEHNNMVPFFGSKSHEVNLEDKTSESILDNYTGSGSQSVNKQEQAPLFAPEDNYQWAYGAPNESDFYQSRVNQSMKMSNVNPFKQESVAPGLGMEYGTTGGDGYNSGMMNRESWMPKDVDSLRVANNPKANGVSLIGLEGPGVSNIKKPGQMGKFEKNRPDRHYENGQDRWFTTGGAVKGETMRSIQTDRFTNRKEVGREYEGVASHQVSGEYIPGKVQKSRHIALGPVPMGTAHAKQKNNASEGDYGIKSKKAYPNNRSTNNETNYFGGIGHSVSAAIAPVMDVLRPSRKENAVGTLRPYQNAGSRVSETYIYDPTQKAPTTHRETMEKSKFHLNINRNQRGGAYEVTEHKASNTSRTKTGDFYYAGNSSAGAGTREMKSYEAEYNQRNNDIKSSTIQGRMVPGNMKLTNHHVNVAQNNRDTKLKNNRALNGTMPAQMATPQHMGVSAQNNNRLYSGINKDRNTGDLNSALQSNPYAVDFTKYM